MKKLIVYLLSLLLIGPMAMAGDKTSKQLEKARNKECKEKIKEYKKEGWKLFGSAHTLEVALLTHYEKLNELGNDGTTIMGTAANVKSKNVGQQMANNNAYINYAQMAGGNVKGRIVSDMAANGTEYDGSEFDHFYEAFEREVQKEIKGEMTPSYTIYREQSDGTYEFQAFFLLSESAASQARIRAMENALKESEAAQKYATKISEFINEGFEQ